MKFTAEMLNTVHDELLQESSEIIKDPEALQSQHYLELMADSEPEVCADLLGIIEHYQEAMPLAFTLGGVDGLNAIVRDVAVLVAVTMLRLQEVADR
jgi:hypothetical protein